jgi:hypothetical protein
MSKNSLIVPQTAEELTLALGGDWKGSTGTACCPAHNDNTPSLSLKPGSMRSIIVKCHAGCSNDDVIDELRVLGFWSEATLENEQGRSREDAGTENSAKNAQSVIEDQLVTPIPPNAPPPPIIHPTRGTPHKKWSYKDDQGDVLFWIYRFQTQKGGKKEILPLTLRQSKSGKLNWEWKAPEAPKSLYGLDRLHRSPEKTVLIVEGEKAADAGQNLFPDYAVISWMGGTGAVDRVEWGALKNREVIIWPDNDQAGKQAAQKVAENVLIAGAESTAIVDLPSDLPKGWDVADKLPKNYNTSWLFDRLSTAVGPDLPLDIFGDELITGKLELKRRHIPPVVFDFAQDTAERIGVDPIVVAAPVIVVAASAIPDATKVQPKLNDDKWLESARLWMALVAEPGFKKSPVLKEVVKPLREVEAKWAQADQLSVESYKLSKIIYDNDLKDFQSKRGKAKPTKESVKSTTPSKRTPPIEPQKPPLRRKVVNDTTVEALVSICAENPGGVLLFVDELTQWIGSLDAYRTAAKGSRDQSIYLSAYNGENVRVDRQTREPVIAENFSVGMLGGIQPGPMATLAPKMTDNGLISRFLVVHGDVATKGVDRVPNQLACDEYELAIKKLAEMPHQENVVKLSPEAYAVRDKYQDRIELMLRDPRTPNPLKHHFRKLEGVVVRIALTFHMIEWAGSNQTNPSLTLAGSTMQMATSFINEILLPNAFKFYRETLGVEQEKDARWIAGHILAHGLTKISIRDIGRVCHHLRNDKVLIKAAMTTLEIGDWVTPIAPKSRGNDVAQWTVNPLVHAAFRTRAETEKKERAAAVASIREKLRANCEEEESDDREE